MPRIVQHPLRLALLDDAARVEDCDPVAHPRDEREVVRDEEDRGVDLVAKTRYQVEHLGLDRRVETGRRLVEDQERRALRECHRDHDALLHATRQLVGIPLEDRCGIGDAHHLERLATPDERVRPARAMHLEHLGDLATHTKGRVQRGCRVLVHDPDLGRVEGTQLGPRQGPHVPSRDGHHTSLHAPVARQVADRSQGRSRLAAARLADEAEGLAATDRQVDASQHLALDPAHAVRDVEATDIEDRVVAHRSTTCWTASLTRFTATTRDAIASAGKRTAHQACST